jgi:4'-phosphopantetheinyl transferase
MQLAGRHSPWLENQVRVWVWQLASHESNGVWTTLLSPEEHARTTQFVFDHHRNLFINAHAGLRCLLGWLLDLPPEQVALGTDTMGKPSLVGLGSPPLFFNLSHSHNHAAVAVSPFFEVGIDIEHIRPIGFEVAEHFFSAGEVAALKALPARRRAKAVFNVWTRKEAYLKALGLGLSVPLDSFDVSVEHPARLQRVAGLPEEPMQWQLAHFIPGNGFVGAVAARARNWHLAIGTGLDNVQ